MQNMELFPSKRQQTTVIGLKWTFSYSNWLTGPGFFLADRAVGISITEQAGCFYLWQRETNNNGTETGEIAGSHLRSVRVTNGGAASCTATHLGEERVIYSRVSKLSALPPCPTATHSHTGRLGCQSLIISQVSPHYHYHVESVTQTRLQTSTKHCWDARNVNTPAPARSPYLNIIPVDWLKSN